MVYGYACLYVYIVCIYFMYTSMCVYVFASYVYMCLYVLCVYMYMYASVCVHVCAHVCYVYMCVLGVDCVDVYLCTCVRVFVWLPPGESPHRAPP